jgi:tetratricopeptide (TPR) repeat protein
MAYEFGRIDDYHTPGAWRGVSESFGYMLDEPEGRDVGFKVLEFSEFDPEDDEVADIWDGPRFDVPALGLKEATAGEIVMACPPLLGGESTINRRIFSLAVNADGEEAVSLWRDCLQTGDPMGHYGLGYTLHGLGRLKEAYRHLRAYTEIVPANPWAWCWLGRTCHALGDTDEARSAYERAIALEYEDEDTTTDAEELLGLLEAGSPPSPAEDPDETTAPEAMAAEPLIVGFDGDGEVWVERSAQIPDEASALAAIAWFDDGHQWIVTGIEALRDRGDGWVQAGPGEPREFWHLTWKEGPVGG